MPYKTIVTANVSDLPEKEFMENADIKIQAQIEYDTIVPNLNPTAVDVGEKLTLMQNECLKRASLIDQEKQCTININAYRDDITNDFVNSWCGQIQTAVAGDEGKVTLLHFGVKKYDDTVPEITVNNSLPSIIKINNMHLQADLEIINDASKDAALPYGAKDLIVFLYFGDTEPTDIKKMQYLGTTKKGKITHHFNVDDIGKTVWFIAVYESKETGKPLANTSPAKKAVVI